MDVMTKRHPKGGIHLYLAYLAGQGVLGLARCFTLLGHVPAYGVFDEENLLLSIDSRGV